MAQGRILLFIALIHSALSVRINFTNCQDPEWFCLNSLPNEIVYNCPNDTSNDFSIHLKDYYTDHITSVTVQNCKDLKVILDCPILQKTSQLRRFKIKYCDRLEFTSLSANSLLQTPPEVEIENVKEIVSLPRRLFKSPTTLTELKCLGATTMKKIKITNSNINVINTRAIYNVTGIKYIELHNVTVTDLREQAIEAIMGSESVFTITSSKLDPAFKGIVVRSNIATVSGNTFDNIITGSINITADNIYLTNNKFKQIQANGLTFKSINTDITHNVISNLKTNALSSVVCLRKRKTTKVFDFSRNIIENIEPYSLAFDYASCKSAGTVVTFTNNKMDCNCRHISYLDTAVTNTELNSVILKATNNNTCLSAPCTLPVDVVKLLLESDMCHLALDPQVLCLLYNDKHSKTISEVTDDDDVTEAAPTFYLIRQANSPNGEPSAAMTALDKDDLLKDSHLNMTNRTAIKIVFDSSKDFVENLRSTNRSRIRPQEPISPIKEESESTCIGDQCRRTVAYDRQKALDFYKYVYAQLRPPRRKS